MRTNLPIVCLIATKAKIYITVKVCPKESYVSMHRPHVYYVNDMCTDAFTYYYDPAMLRNKLTPLSIFRDLALRKRD